MKQSRYFVTSLNLLMILWTVDDKISKLPAVALWETMLLNCWNICSHSWSQSGETSPHPCSWLTEPFEGAPFISSHVFLQPVHLSNAPKLILPSFLNFNSILSQLFCNTLQHHIQNKRIFAKITIKFTCLNTKYLVYSPTLTGFILPRDPMLFVIIVEIVGVINPVPITQPCQKFVK